MVGYVWVENKGMDNESKTVVSIKKEDGIFEPVVILQIEDGVFQTNRDCSWVISVGIFDLGEGDQRAIWFFGSWSEDVVLYLFVDLFVPLVGFCLQGEPQFFFFFYLVLPESWVYQVFVFVGESVDCAWRLVVELLLVLHSPVFICEVAKFVPCFHVLFVFQAGDIVHFLDCGFEELIEFYCDVFAHILYFWFLALQWPFAFDVVLNGCWF